MADKPPIPGSHEPGFIESPLVEGRVPPVVRQLNPLSRGLRHWMLGECAILRAREPAGANGELLWHLTISHPDRHPSWDEMKVARYRLLPLDLCFGLLLPPPDLYVNVPTQDHVFHLWEITDPRAPWEGG